MVPHFPVLHFSPLHFWSCIFQSCIFNPAFSGSAFLSWKFGPSFSSRVGRSLIYLVPHWSFIFRSCIFSRPIFFTYCVAMLLSLCGLIRQHRYTTDQSVNYKTQDISTAAAETVTPATADATRTKLFSYVQRAPKYNTFSL